MEILFLILLLTSVRSQMIFDISTQDFVASTSDNGTIFARKSANAGRLTDTQRVGFIMPIVSSSGYIHVDQNRENLLTSSDYGLSWRSRSVPGTFKTAHDFAYVRDSSGQYLAAFMSGYPGSTALYYSIDHGDSWSVTPNSANSRWYCMAMDSTGTYVIACVMGGALQISSDHGQSFSPCSQSSCAGSFESAAISEGGQYMFALQGANGNPLPGAISTDYGKSWGLLNIPAHNFARIACSNSGKYVLASSFGGAHLLSTDFGSSFSGITLDSGWPSSVLILDNGYLIIPPVQSNDLGKTWRTLDPISNNTLGAPPSRANSAPTIAPTVKPTVRATAAATTTAPTALSTTAAPTPFPLSCAASSPCYADVSTGALNFGLTKVPETFTAPRDGVLRMRACGAQGGHYAFGGGGPAGLGGFVQADMSVKAGQQLVVLVGGAGGEDGVQGGFNGGGNGGWTASAPGGGLSSITAESKIVMVGAGGGGGGTSQGAGGGGAGGESGGAGSCSQCGSSAGGASQSGPGGGGPGCGCYAGGAGSKLQGGAGQCTGGGGGGGYFGGGGASGNGGGGGGSSYIDPSLTLAVYLTGVQEGNGCVSLVMVQPVNVPTPMPSSIPTPHSSLAPTFAKPSPYPTPIPTSKPSPAPTNSFHPSSPNSAISSANATSPSRKSHSATPTSPGGSLSDGMGNAKLPKIPLTSVTILCSVALFSVLLSYYIWKTRAALEKERSRTQVDNADPEAYKQQGCPASGLVNIGLFDVQLSVTLAMTTFTSNALQCLALFHAGNSLIDAATIVVVRVANTIVAIYTLYSSLGESQLSNYLRAAMLHKGLIWTVVAFVSLLDPSLIRLMPWKFTEFSQRSGGFPTLFVFNVTLFSIAATNVVMLAVSSLSFFFQSSSLVSFSLSLFSFLVTAITVLFRYQAEKIHKINNQLVISTLLWQKNVELSAEKSERERLAREVEELKREKEQREAQQRHAQNLIELERITKEMFETAKRAEQQALKKGKLFDTNIKYADETVEILKGQVKSHGGQPLEFIPLDELNAELQQLFDKINAGEVFDERRLEYLMQCLELNPEYRAQKEAEQQAWREQSAVFAEACYEMMRGFVPPFIFSASRDRLEREGYSKALAKRLLEKKCLWLLRLPDSDIIKLHDAELTSRYGYDGQGLDIVELAALYFHVPKKFPNDALGKKAAWVSGLESALQRMMKDDEAGKLIKAKQRSAAYLAQDPLFSERMSLYSQEIVQGADPSSASTMRDSFILKRLSAPRRLDPSRASSLNFQASAASNPLHNDRGEGEESSSGAGILVDHIPRARVLHANNEDLQANLTAAIMKRIG